MPISRIPSYRDLIVWQKAMLLVTFIYEITAKMPSSERFGLIDQLRRSAVSIPSNIAQGKQRYSQKECRNFVNIAYASIAEVETQLEIAKRLGYCSQHDCRHSLSLLSEIGKMSNGLLKSLKAKRKASIPEA